MEIRGAGSGNTKLSAEIQQWNKKKTVKENRNRNRQEPRKNTQNNGSKGSSLLALRTVHRNEFKCLHEQTQSNRW